MAEQHESMSADWFPTKNSVFELGTTFLIFFKNRNIAEDLRWRRRRKGWEEFWSARAPRQSARQHAKSPVSSQGFASFARHMRMPTVEAGLGKTEPSLD